MPQVKLVLFGTPKLTRDEHEIHLTLRKAHGLLAYLAVTAQPHSRDHLATLFWPEASQKSARSNLRRMLYDIGQRIDGELLESSTDMVGIAPEVDLWLDVAAFRQCAQVGLDDPQQVDQLRAASEIYQDEFLAGFSLKDCPEFDEWHFFQREALRQLLAQAYCSG